MPYDEERIAASIFKALKERHEILSYLRVQILAAVSKNMQELTDDEVKEYILWMQNEQKKKS